MALSGHLRYATPRARLAYGARCRPQRSRRSTGNRARSAVQRWCWGRCALRQAEKSSTSLRFTAWWVLMPGSTVTLPTGRCETLPTRRALLNLTREMAVSWAPYGINVNVINPGMFPVEANMNKWPTGTFERIRQRIPLGRAPVARPTSMARWCSLRPRHPLTSPTMTWLWMRMDGLVVRPAKEVAHTP